MNDDIFVQIFGGIDEKYIREANEDMNFWLESQEGEVVRADGSRRFPWRTVIASVACTAAALFGVFVLMLNVGKIRITDTTESSVNSPAQSGVTPALPADAVLYDEAAYAYENGSSFLKRFAVGDKFGENATIASAKATYKSVDGKAVLQKQEIILNGEVYFITGTYETNENDDVIRLDIDVGLIKDLGLPHFGDDFEIQPIEIAITDENTHDGLTVCVSFINPKITVDHDTKIITINSQNIDYFCVKEEEGFLVD